MKNPICKRYEILETQRHDCPSIIITVQSTALYIPRVYSGLSIAARISLRPYPLHTYTHHLYLYTAAGRKIQIRLSACRRRHRRQFHPENVPPTLSLSASCILYSVAIAAAAHRARQYVCIHCVMRRASLGE